MKRDTLGICLSKDMLSDHLLSTFTRVRAYEMESNGFSAHIYLTLHFFEESWAY